MNMTRVSFLDRIACTLCVAWSLCVCMWWELSRDRGYAAPKINKDDKIGGIEYMN